jgi:hypothetical protein
VYEDADAAVRGIEVLMRGKLSVWVIVALVTATAALRAVETLRIVPLVRDDAVTVSFELDDAYMENVREAIASGLRTTFTYDIELRMVVPAWVDRTIATAVVTVSDQYDNLTRRHSLSRSIDGRAVDALVTDDEAVVKEWLTSFKRLPLCSTSKLDPNRDHYVRISARARPSGASILGWASPIIGQARFTYIP